MRYIPHTEGDVARKTWIGVHVASSLLWLAVYVLHQFSRRTE